MKFSLCNEMFEGVPMAEICSIASRLGYHGIEIAPFTLAASAAQITEGQKKEVRQALEDHGLEAVGLHWLFAGPTGLHMTTTDDKIWGRTRDYLSCLLDLCGELGGKILVLGSPKQRSLVEGQTQDGAGQRAVDLLASVMDQAGALGLTICLEPLSPVETDFINTVAEGMEIVRQVNHPSLKIHLDVKAMCSEPTPVPDVIRSVSAADIGHFHVNDANLYGPGMGDVDYGPIAEAVKDVGWDKWLSVEVFKYDPDPETIARKSIEYLRKFWR
ncbi:MAG: sugar phosphate isomerase/epimerase family protein [Planctomycetota bacterium]|jgi:sugar phosphate isomerase/epimerase